MLPLASSLLVAAVLAAASDVVVVCPPGLRGGLDSWLQQRQAQGHEIAVVSSAGGIEAIQARIRRVAAEGRLRFILLAGDVDDDGRTGVPAFIEPVQAISAYCDEQSLASDAPYALDLGAEPGQVCVGRCPAHSAVELAAMLARGLDFERSIGGGVWARRLNLVAGTGGFGPLADFVLEHAVKSLLVQEVPPAYATHIAYANWRSPYCPDPRRFRERTLESLSGGCLLWVYLGHGSRRALDAVQSPEGLHPILHARDVRYLAPAECPPIAVLLACSTGAYDSADDCLAESLLRAPHGPVAVVAGSRVTLPYGNSVLGRELIRAGLQGHAETLGEAFAQARAALCSPLATTGPDADLDAAAGLFCGSREQLRAERAEHALLYNLLGDPLLKLPRPQQVDVAATGLGRAGERLSIRGSSPLAGPALFELVVRRDRFTTAIPAREDYAALRADPVQAEHDYRLANDQRLAVQRVQLAGGDFTLSLAAPEHAGGACFVRVFVTDGQEYGLGAAAVELESRPLTARTATETTR